MRPLRFALASIAIIALAAAPASAGEAPGKPSPPHAAFERMKSLVGAWEMKGEDGKVTTLTYTLVSDGTALMETMDAPGIHAVMVTMYHPDGADLLMTHYCGAGNQPRMRCPKLAGDASSLAFAYVDATNLSAPGAGHMHDLVITFVDADHFNQEWTWKQGDEEGRDLFKFERKRS